MVVLISIVGLPGTEHKWEAEKRVKFYLEKNGGNHEAHYNKHFVFS